jgi:hypothetical protein
LIIRILLLFIMLVGNILTINAQSDYSIELLPQFNLSKSFKKSQRLFFRTEPRFRLADNNSSTLSYIRTDFFILYSLKISADWQFAAGYTTRHSNTSIGHRFTQQFSTITKLENLRLAHRFLSDQTYFANRPLSIRLRYRIGLELPLQGETVDEKEFYLRFANEYLLAYRKPNLDAEIRVFAGSGYVLNKTFRLEAGVDYRAENILSGFVNRFYLFQGLFLAF